MRLGLQIAKLVRMLAPNYSFKRTAVTGCATITRYAAAAA